MQKHHKITRRSETTKGMVSVESYVFRVELFEEDDGRWSVWIDALPGCAAWGGTKEDAMRAIQDAAEAYVEDMIEAGDALPKNGVFVINAPVVAITPNA